MPYDNGPMILGITWMEIGLVLIAIAVRFFARVNVTKNVGVEDWTMLVAVVCTRQTFLPRFVHVSLSISKTKERDLWNHFFCFLEGPL